VIVTATAEIQPDAPIAAVAITSTLKDPLGPEYVELPWKRGGHPRTGLKQRCAAVCNWLIAIQQDAVKDFAGTVPPPQLLAILEKLPRQNG
jgi:hypothetical protein